MNRYLSTWHIVDAHSQVILDTRAVWLESPDFLPKEAAGVKQSGGLGSPRATRGGSWTFFP